MADQAQKLQLVQMSPQLNVGGGGAVDPAKPGADTTATVAPGAGAAQELLELDFYFLLISLKTDEIKKVCNKLL